MTLSDLCKSDGIAVIPKAEYDRLTQLERDYQKQTENFREVNKQLKNEYCEKIREFKEIVAQSAKYTIRSNGATFYTNDEMCAILSKELETLTENFKTRSDVANKYFKECTVLKDRYNELAKRVYVLLSSWVRMLFNKKERKKLMDVWLKTQS